MFHCEFVSKIQPTSASLQNDLLLLLPLKRVSCVNPASKSVFTVPCGGLLQEKSFLMSFPASEIEHLVYFSVKDPIWNCIELLRS